MSAHRVPHSDRVPQFQQLCDLRYVLAELPPAVRRPRLSASSVPPHIHRNRPSTRHAADHLIPAAPVKSCRVREQKRRTIARPLPHRKVDATHGQDGQARAHSFQDSVYTEANMQIDRAYARETLEHLVRINSVNPTLAPGAPGEREIATFIAQSVAQVGLAVQTCEPEPGRMSVVGRLAGGGGGRSLMLNAHCDTVDVAGMVEPFSGEIRDGKIYGRGAYDMKGSLAACMAAAKALAESRRRVRGDLLVAAVADEEYGSLGTRDLLTRLHVDGAIVTEPTALNVCLAHKGYLWIEVAVRGRA